MSQSFCSNCIDRIFSDACSLTDLGHKMFSFVNRFVTINREAKTIMFTIVLFLEHCQYDWEDHSRDYSTNYTRL